MCGFVCFDNPANTKRNLLYKKNGMILLGHVFFSLFYAPSSFLYKERKALIELRIQCLLQLHQNPSFCFLVNKAFNVFIVNGMAPVLITVLG